MDEIIHILLTLLLALSMYTYHHINQLRENNTRTTEELRSLRNELQSARETIYNFNRESKAKEEKCVDITKLTSDVSSLRQELSLVKDITSMQIQSIRQESERKEEIQRGINEDIRSMRDDFIRTLRDVEKILDHEERLQKDLMTLNQDLKQVSDKIDDIQRSMDDISERGHQHHHVHGYKNESRSFGGMLVSAVRYGISVTARSVLEYTFGGIFAVVSGFLN